MKNRNGIKHIELYFGGEIEVDAHFKLEDLNVKGDMDGLTDEEFEERLKRTFITNFLLVKQMMFKYKLGKDVGEALARDLLPIIVKSIMTPNKFQKAIEEDNIEAKISDGSKAMEFLEKL